MATGIIDSEPILDACNSFVSPGRRFRSDCITTTAPPTIIKTNTVTNIARVIGKDWERE